MLVCQYQFHNASSILISKPNKRKFLFTYSGGSNLESDFQLNLFPSWLRMCLYNCQHQNCFPNVGKCRSMTDTRLIWPDYMYYLTQKVTFNFSIQKVPFFFKFILKLCLDRYHCISLIVIFCTAEYFSSHGLFFHQYLVMKDILILAVMLQTQKKPCSVCGFDVEQALEHPVAMKVASKESYYQ